MSTSKKKVLVTKYKELRKRIKDWENAFSKSSGGRKPTESDMKLAPKDIRTSYKEFVKVQRYLKENPVTPKKTATTALTPGKIFLVTHRSELQRGDRSTVTIPRSKGHASTTEVGKNSSKNFELGRNSSDPTSPSKQSFGVRHKSFNKLFKFSAENKLKSFTSRNGEENGQEYNVEGQKVTEVAIERNVLSPKKVTAQNHGLNGSHEITGDTCEDAEFTRRSLSSRSSFKLDAAGSVPELQFNFAKTGENPAVAALKSPLIKRKASIRSTIVVDSEWLNRLNNDDDSIKSPTLDNPLVSSEFSKNVLNDSGGESMDVDEAVTEEDIFSSLPDICQNSDSGIDGTTFNSTDVHQAIQEVLEETSGQNNMSLSVNDCSLMNSFSEDACLPPFTDDESPDIGKDISNIIEFLSEKDTEEPFSESVTNSRKRPADNSCPASPENRPERKFFKSDRKRNTLYKHNMSYRPESPVKKGRAGKQESLRPTKRQSPPASPVKKERAVKRARGKQSERQSPLSSPETRRVTRSGGLPQTGERTPNESEDVLFKSKSPKRQTKTRQPKQPKPKASKSTNSNRKGRKNLRSIKSESDSDGEDERGHESGETESKNQTVIQTGVVDCFNEVQDAASITRRRGKRFAGQTDKTALAHSSKNVNENYVRIDTKRKVFVRGHKKKSVIQFKRRDWRQRISAAAKEAKATLSCNNCGEKGHFAKFCMKEAESACPGEVDDSPFPTLEEAAKMVWKSDRSSDSTRVNIYSNVTSNLSLTLVKPEPSEESTTLPELVKTVLPYVEKESNESQYERDLLDEQIKDSLRAFGYDSFRPGQKETVTRVLMGQSTLVVLSTGSGKSLCYQLPAYLYGKKYPGALTLCISPLVSLMEDQIQGIPAFLNAACLHSNMTAKQKDIVLEKVKSKKLHILLVSPEAVCGGLFGLLKGNTGTLPTISFACIDEVHCVSQWSHNFRPSYLQLCKLLREKLNVKTILGLTATATSATAISICEHLDIDPSTTIRGELMPKNLQLSVSRDVHKDQALIDLLHGERLRDCDSVIIYCTRREECERIATLVRTQFQETADNKIKMTKSRTRLSGNCEAYHAGMSARRRKLVQDGFMSGEIRIVVATVAFGMGIDKSDIRAVIHFNMPNTFESYVQEIGRAGRDGLPAHCHLFLDNANRNDLSELKRHVYANSVDRSTIRKLLRKIFQSCKCRRIEELKGEADSASKASKIDCPGHEVSFSIQNAVHDLDLPQENITTLLCYLELDERKWVDILPLTYETCKIQSYGGPKLFKAAATRCPPLAVAIALQTEKKKFRDTDSYLEFNVIEVAATVGWNSGVVKKELKNLEWTGSSFDAAGNSTRFRKSGLLVEFSELAYRVMSPGSLSEADADKVLNSLHGRNVKQEQTQLYQLHRVYEALMSVSLPNINTLCDAFDDDKSQQLKNFIYEYFTEDSTNAVLELPRPESVDEDKVEELRRSIHHLTNSYRDVHFTPRSVAKIFQGISSPNFPADQWYKNRDFWRRYLDVDFHFICQIASVEL